MRAVTVLFLLAVTVTAGVASECPPGTSGPGGMPPCTPCPIGSHAPVPGMSECPRCVMGLAAPSPGLAECITCAAGQYAPEGPGGATACVDCPPGSYSYGPGFDYCLGCVEDQYQPEAGQTRCLDCPPGQHAFGGGAHCLTCRPLRGKLRLFARDFAHPSWTDLKFVADVDLADPAGFASLDPTTQRVAVIVRRHDGRDVVYVGILPATYGGPGTLGWTRTPEGSRWRYRDDRPVPAWIESAVIADLGRTSPGRVRLTVVGKDGIFPFQYSDPPLTVLIMLGAEGAMCAESAPLAAECRFHRRRERLQCLRRTD